MTVTNSTFTNNSAPGDEGGAIYAYGGATIGNSTFTGNSASYGGAIYEDDVTKITKSTFTQNSTLFDEGGAIYADWDLSVDGSLFQANAAAPNYSYGYGGGIY